MGFTTSITTLKGVTSNNGTVQVAPGKGLDTSAAGALVLGGANATSVAALGGTTIAGVLSLGRDGVDEPGIALSTKNTGYRYRMQSWSNVSSGTLNPLCNFGYNFTANGIDVAGEPAWGDGWEGHFNDGSGNHWCERHLHAYFPDATYRRMLSVITDRVGGAHETYAQFNAKSFILSNSAGSSTGLTHIDGHLGVGNVAPGNVALLVTQAVETSASPNALRITGGAHTTLAASTQASDVYLALGRTVQFAAGAISNQSAVYIEAPTYAFVGDSTITDAATLEVAGPPAAGAHATLTDAMAAKFGGKVRVVGVLDVIGNSMSFHDAVGDTTGLDIKKIGANLYGIEPRASGTNFRISQYCVLSGLDGTGFKFTIQGGYNNTANYPWLDVSNPYAATNTVEAFAPPSKMTHSAWNTGGTPAAESWVWTEQQTSVQGNPSTAFWKLQAKRGGAAAQQVLALPGQPITVSGAKGGNAALASLMTALTTAFPFLNDTTGA